MTKLEPTMVKIIESDSVEVLAGALASHLASLLYQMRSSGRGTDADGVIAAIEKVSRTGQGSVIPAMSGH
jgi:hypothetical protein